VISQDLFSWIQRERPCGVWLDSDSLRHPPPNSPFEHCPNTPGHSVGLKQYLEEQLIDLDFSFLNRPKNPDDGVLVNVHRSLPSVGHAYEQEKIRGARREKR